MSKFHKNKNNNYNRNRSNRSTRALPGMSHKFQPKEVRVIDNEGEQKGIIPLAAAFKMADELGLDLVCVAPKSQPPVCKIMDYGKFKYEKKKAEKESKKKQHTVQVKSVKFRPKIGDHDLDVKLKKVTKFLEEGNRVKLVMMFRGRENVHKDVGAEILYDVLDKVEALGKPEGNLQLEGRNISVIIAPSK